MPSALQEVILNWLHVRFEHQYCWRCKSSGMWCHVTGHVLADSAVKNIRSYLCKDTVWCQRSWSFTIIFSLHLIFRETDTKLSVEGKNAWRTSEKINILLCNIHNSSPYALYSKQENKFEICKHQNQCAAGQLSHCVNAYIVNYESKSVSCPVELQNFHFILNHQNIHCCY